MRRLHVIILFIMLIAMVLLVFKLELPFSFHSMPENPDQAEPGNGSEPFFRTATLAAVGGLYPHRAVLSENYLGNGRYDFWPAFEFIAPHFKKADLAMLTLETMQAGPEISLWGVSGYTGHTEKGILTFNAPIELSCALKKAGINLYSFANNHCLDRAVEGLQASLQNTRELGFHTTGAYLSKEEREAVDLVDVNGLKIAFIAYTYGTNCIPVPRGSEYVINLAPSFDDISPVIADIKSAQAIGADIVVIIPHWGEQYVDSPFEWQRKIAREMAEAGADIIIGSHPKFVQPCEWIKVLDSDGGVRSVPVIYSLGNFYTDQHYPACFSDLVEYGLLLNFKLTKNMNSGKTWISELDYDIHWCHRAWRHRMLVLSDVFEKGPDKFNLDQSSLEKLKEKYRENIKIVERFGFTEKGPDCMKRKP